MTRIEWSIVSSRKIVEDPVEHTKQVWIEIAPSEDNVLTLSKLAWEVFNISFWWEINYTCYLIEKTYATEKWSWIPKISEWILQAYWVHLEIQIAPQLTGQKCFLIV